MFAEAMEGRTLLSAVVYDPVAQFSTTTNPGTFWTYGSSTSEFAQVAPLQYEGPYNVTGVDSSIGGVWNYSTASAEQPLVGCNTTSQAYTDGAIQIPANEIVMHPGPSGAPQFADLLFTAPASGTYTLDFTFLGMDSGGPDGGTSTSVHAIYNGSSIFDGQLDGGGDTASPDSPIVLNNVTQGQTIDFAVGYGPDGSYGYDSTGLSGTITQTPATLAIPTVTVSASANPVGDGTPVTLMANVSGSGPTPAGKVSFYYTANGSTTQIGGPVSLDSDGNAVSSAISDLPVGDDTITAVYSGDNVNYDTANSAPGSITVVAPTVTLAASRTTATTGQSVKLTADVSESDAPTPGEIVDFFTASTDLGQATTNGAGKATLSTKELPAGDDPVEATVTASDGTQVDSNTVDVTDEPKLKAPKIEDPKGAQRSTEPTFNWTSVLDLDPDTTYSLRIMDVTPGVADPYTVDQTDLMGNSYIPVTPLKPAHSYEWMVQATDDLPGIGTATTPWSMPGRFTIDQQKTNSFMVRVDNSVTIGKKTLITLTAFTTNDAFDNAVNGPPRYLKLILDGYTGPDFTMQTTFSPTSSGPLETIDEIGTPSRGAITINVQASTALSGGGYSTEIDFSFPLVSFSVFVNTSTPYAADQFDGKLTVVPSPHYDNTIWPDG